MFISCWIILFTTTPTNLELRILQVFDYTLLWPDGDLRIHTSPRADAEKPVLSNTFTLGLVERLDAGEELMQSRYWPVGSCNITRRQTGSGCWCSSSPKLRSLPTIECQIRPLLSMDPWTAEHGMDSYPRARKPTWLFSCASGYCMHRQPTWDQSLHFPHQCAE